MKNSQTKTICLIPSRGGSKRIKNKNIKKFMGKPFLTRVINVARKSKIFKEIYVSTDSQKIKKLAERSGAKVPFLRSKKLSNDHTIIKDVIDDFVYKVIEKKDILKINIFVLYPTSVFITKQILKRCFRLLKNTEYVTLLKKFPHPIHRALKYKNKKIEPINLKKKLMRTQDLEEYFYNSGQLDCFKLKAWVKKSMFHKMNAKFIIIDELNSVDIDNNNDLKIANKIFKMNKLS